MDASDAAAADAASAAALSEELEASELDEVAGATLDELEAGGALPPHAASASVAANTSGNPRVVVIFMIGFLFGRSCLTSPQRGS